MNISKRDIPYFAKIVGALLLITMFVALLLSFVNMITKDVIAENDAKKTAEAIKQLFPDAASPVTDKLDVSLDDASFEALYKVTDGDTEIGYYAEVYPKGFKGEIAMLVGISPDGKVLGIRIVTHGETVGIGDRIEDEAFLDTLTGVSGSVSYSKDKTDTDIKIDGISGATYSSKAVIYGTNTALKAYKAYKGGAAQ